MTQAPQHHPSSTHPGAHLSTAQRLLWEPFGLTVDSAAAVLRSICKPKVDYADLYFQYCQSESWALEEGIVKTGSFSIDQGVGVRAISGEKTAFAYSDDISKIALANAAQAVCGIGRMGASQHSKGVQVTPRRKSGAAILNTYPQITGAAIPALFPSLNPIHSMDSEAKVALLKHVDTLARAADSRVVQVMAQLSAEYDVILVLRADGHLAADVRPLVRLSLAVVAEENGRRETGSGGGGARLDLAYFDDARVEDYVKQAVAGALVNLQARPAPAGEMPVVLGSGWPGVMLHEAVGHGLEGDFNRKGASAFSGKIGTQVAAKGVTILDDGTLPNRRGSLNIDDEGHPTQATVLIEDGILRGYMQDSLNARLMGVRPTGNGRRESYTYLPMPRMTNTYMLAGDKEPDEIIASLKRGLYAVHFGGGQVDITSGKFVFSATEAYWVENGKIQYPVKGATIIGNGPEAMQRVSMIGNNLCLDGGVGTCIKDGQNLPVGVGQPSLRIESLIVGGTAGSED